MNRGLLLLGACAVGAGAGAFLLQDSPSSEPVPALHGAAGDDASEPVRGEQVVPARRLAGRQGGTDALQTEVTAASIDAVPAVAVGESANRAGGFRDSIEFHGVPFSQLDLDALPLERLHELRRFMKRHQGDVLTSIRKLPPNELDLYTGLEAEAANLRWGTDYLTYYNHEGETYVLRLERGRFPEVYELASMVEEICATNAYSEFVERKRVDFEARVRAEHPETELVFVTNFDGSAIYAYRADDVGGELVTMTWSPKHE